MIIMIAILKDDKMVFINQYYQIMELDNECDQPSTRENLKKPLNKRTIKIDDITFSSEMGCGNLNKASISPHPQYPHQALIEFEGNPDVGGDIRDKCWFYFSISGVSQYTRLHFVLKNGNSFRKFVKEKKYRPYVVIKDGEEWKPILINKFNNVQAQVIEVEFTYTPQTDLIYVAHNYPYSLEHLHQNQSQFKLKALSTSQVYLHIETIATSSEQLPIYMYTLTHKNNIASSEQRQSPFVHEQISERPFRLKNRLEIVITGRVHPSEVSSSYFIDGLLSALLQSQFSILLQFFLFRIVPMVNPDGVENGNYRRDNFLQNLNRYYGYSKPSTTPAIFALEAFIHSLREKQTLFMFLDIHGHNSPKPSFIIGNYNSNIAHAIENKTLCKLLQNVAEGFFSYSESLFCKNNSSIKQKYDEHSKEASARVFAFHGSQNEEKICQSVGSKSNIKRNIVQHSYTVEIIPYIISKKIKSKCKMQSEILGRSSQPTTRKQPQEFIEVTYEETMELYGKLGRWVLISLMEMVGMNKMFGFVEGQDGAGCRKTAYRQLLKFGGEYHMKGNIKLTSKTINMEMMRLYQCKMEPYIPINIIKKSEYDDCPLIQLFRHAQRGQMPKKNLIFANKLISNEVNQEQILDKKEDKEEQPKFKRERVDGKVDSHEIQDKIRRLVFRHKTDSSTYQYPHKKRVMKYQMVHLNTEGNQSTEPILDGKILTDQDVFNNKNLQVLAQRIFVTKKKQLETLISDKESINVSSSNVKVRKEKARIASQQKYWNRRQTDRDDYITLSSKIILPPVRQKQEEIKEKHIIRSRMPGCHKSVKIKIKKEVMQDKMREEEINDITDSFRVIASNSKNRMDFILKARKMISEKKQEEKGTIAPH